MHRLLIATDKFKTTLSSREVADALAKGIYMAYPQATITTLILSDGGEGFIEALEQAQPLERFALQVPGPTGQLHPGYLGISKDGKTLYIESCQATGFHLIPSAARNPFNTSSVGLAVLLRQAIALKPETIYIGLGSSATCDGGLPVAREFGYQFMDQQGHALHHFPHDLNRIHQLVKPQPWPITLSLYAVADVTNPPVGSEGGIHIYAPQKGATPEQVECLEQGMVHFMSLLQPDFADDLRYLVGGGSAGCLGLGLYSLFGAKLLPGASFMIGQLGLKQRILEADSVITGEGSFDEQSLWGKIPGEVVKIAHQLGKPVFVVAGKATYPTSLSDQIQGFFSIETLLKQGKIKGSIQGLQWIGQCIGNHLKLKSDT